MEKEEKQDERFQVIEIPTQMGFGFKDNETGDEINQLDLLAEMASSIDKIKQEIVGKK